MIEGLSEITLFDRNTVIHCDNISIAGTATHDEIIKKASESDEAVWYTVRFISPANFKSAGKYTIFPSAELILKSLISSWNRTCENYILDDEDMLNILLAGVEICGYRLSSAVYRMKGQNIRSFIGTVQLHAKLPPPVMQIYKTLLYFGGFSGVGIKTALGMGGLGLYK